MRDTRGRFVKGTPGIDPRTGLTRADRIHKVCARPGCNVEFDVKPSLDRVRYCSQSCAKLGKPSGWAGRTPSAETRQKMREAKLGIRGSDHWNFKHGLQEKRPTHPRTAWRNAVIERDNYTCQKCGLQGRKGQMDEFHAHHIKTWLEHPKLRYNVDNGLLLCAPCHRNVHREMKQGVR